MNNIPNQIDGAKLFFHLVLDNNRHTKTNKTKHSVDGRMVNDIYGLAICQYGDDSGYYLFYCNNQWEVITDTYHDSIEQAKEQAEFEFTNTLTGWIKTD